jgi:pimeloyl-ACP methyl ester carboxylesterase
LLLQVLLIPGTAKVPSKIQETPSERVTMTSSDRDTAPRFLSVRGRRTRYVISGDGPPVVLLHGIGRSLEDWSEVLHRLAEAHTVYSVDLAGFGESERLGTPTDLPSLARAVADFLDEAGETRRIRLVGNSLGGAVALQTTALFPDRVVALVLVDSVGFGSGVTPALRILGVPGLGRLLLRPTRILAGPRARSVFYDHSLATQERIDLLQRLSRRPGASDVFLETARSLATWRGIRPEWRRELIAKVAALDLPVLLLWGSEDRILPPRQLEHARKAFPDAESHFFPRTGHMPQLERPDEFFEIVDKFLKQVDE